MAVTRRGANQYVSSSASTSHNVPLPSGSAAGDWVIVGASNGTFGASFTMPGTELLDEGSNTMRFAISTKQLTSTDITNNYLNIAISSSQQCTAVIVGYSSAGGFATPGTIWKKGVEGGTFSNLAYTIAEDVTSFGVDILCFSLIKHSGGAQSFSSISSPATTLATALKTGTSMPSAHVGVYTGTPTDITSTWSVASTNGIGVQVAVLDVAPDDLFGIYTGSGFAPIDTVLSILDVPAEALGIWNGSSIDGIEG